MTPAIHFRYTPPVDGSLPSFPTYLRTYGPDAPYRPGYLGTHRRGALRKRAIEDSFWDHVMPEPNTGCWLWAGVWNKKGYGTLRSIGAHRISYQIHKGPIPENYQIDHLCRVRCCVNPQHLEAVTLQENVARGEVGQYNARKTHCRNGHEFTPENTRWSGNERGCRTCVVLLKRVRRRALGLTERMIPIVYGEQSHYLKEWSRITGISHSTISKRLKRGMAVGQALGYE